MKITLPTGGLVTLALLALLPQPGAQAGPLHGEGAHLRDRGEIRGTVARVRGSNGLDVRGEDGKTYRVRFAQRFVRVLRGRKPVPIGSLRPGQSVTAAGHFISRTFWADWVQVSAEGR